MPISHLSARAAAALLLVIATAAAAAAESPACPAAPQRTLLEERPGKAGIFANIRRAKGSVTYETGQLLRAADRLPEEQPPDQICPASCEPARPPKLLLTTIPAKFRSGYSQEASCAKLLEQTTAAPFRYHGRSFRDLEALNDWFAELSQGDGKDGKDLYERCSGECSPQYFTTISKTADGYLVDADVRCGHARDKDDNSYTLSSFHLWSCAGKGGQ